MFETKTVLTAILACAGYLAGAGAATGAPASPPGPVLHSAVAPDPSGAPPADHIGRTDHPARHAPRQEPTDQGAFIMSIGNDTLGVETFSRTTRTLAGEIAGQRLGRLRYTATLTPDALVSRWEMSAWPPNTPATAPPAQTADIAFQGDSVIAELTAAGGTQTQRFQTETGALPTFPTSIALLEQAVRRALVIGGDRVELPLFALAGGVTTRATLTRIAPDSVTIAAAGSEVRLQVDDAGRVLGGTIPAQRLTITRVGPGSDAEAAKRAGESTPPDYSAPPDAPYIAEEVTVPVPAAAPAKSGHHPPGDVTAASDVATHTLAGTLTTPKDRTGPVPAVITITGSGPQRRDEDVFPGYAPFRELADALGRRGIAVLRLDDRGVGASTGDFATATTADFADDIRAAIAYLHSRPEIDPRRIALVGHSEGGLIAPMIASADTTIAALVLLAPPAQTGREIIAYQHRYMIGADTTLKTDAARDSAAARAVEQLENAAAVSPWLRFFLDYDPLPTAAKVRQPVLILHGATDRQVTPDQAERLAVAIRGGGNIDVEVHILPDTNHLLLADPDGHPMGYATLPSTKIAPEILQTIGDWLTKRFRDR